MHSDISRYLPLVGIFGGTFDPVHNGHLRIAEDACERLDFSEIRFVPLGNAVHRMQPHADAVHRRAMLELALREHDCLQLDCRELEQARPSFMVDTLTDLRAERADAALCLILGTDAFAAFDSWREPQGILALAHLLVLQRPGQAAEWSDGVAALMDARVVQTAEALHTEPAGRILFQTFSQVDISSTAIRQRLETDQAVAGLMPVGVERYIAAHGLYRG